jgi:hypothetical protein
VLSGVLWNAAIFAVLINVLAQLVMETKLIENSNKKINFNFVLFKGMNKKISSVVIAAISILTALLILGMIGAIA